MYKLDPLHPRMLCAKFGCNWSSGSGEEDFKILSMYYCYFTIISILEKGSVLIWTNMVKWFLIRRFFKISSMSFCYFLIISPWKRVGLFICTIPFTQGCFVLSLEKLTQLFWRRRWKCEKFTTTTTMPAQNGQILIRNAHPSLRVTWPKNQEGAIGNNFIGLTYHTWSALFGCQGKIERNRCSHRCCRINSEVEKYCLKKKSWHISKCFCISNFEQNFSILEVILQHMKTHALFQCQAPNHI